MAFIIIIELQITQSLQQNPTYKFFNFIDHMMIDLKFWKNKPTRPNNPSYSSKLVEESMFIQSFEKERFKPKYSMIYPQQSEPMSVKIQKAPKREVLAQSLPIFAPVKAVERNANESQKPILQRSAPKPASFPTKQQHKIKQKLQTNIKGLTSEFNDFISSSNEVYQRQQKPFDIIKGTLRNYKSQINLFPKLRLQRLDSDYQIRQAFIRGDLQKIKNLEERSKSEVRFFANRKYQNEGDDFKPERIMLRRREPVEFAFKITQNPEIIKKKLMLEK